MDVKCGFKPVSRSIHHSVTRLGARWSGVWMWLCDAASISSHRDQVGVGQDLFVARIDDGPTSCRTLGPSPSPFPVDILAPHRTAPHHQLPFL